MRKKLYKSELKELWPLCKALLEKDSYLVISTSVATGWRAMLVDKEVDFIEFVDNNKMGL